MGQSLEVQRDKVTAAGVEPKNVFEEKRSGLDTGRPELKACLRSLRKGDTLVITKIDCLARSAVDLLGIVRELEKDGVALKVLDQSIDTGQSGRDQENAETMTVPDIMRATGLSKASVYRTFERV
jgi:DNA invertase Pin-like site-specific DNA recombinase